MVLPGDARGEQVDSVCRVGVFPILCLIKLIKDSPEPVALRVGR
jgi:hypothetical protein